MPKFNVEVSYAGYSRGYQNFLVEAESAEEAMQNFWRGQETDTNEMRNDWDREANSAELVVEDSAGETQ